MAFAPRALGAGMVALLCLGAGLWLAAQHPLAPGALLLILVLLAWQVGQHPGRLWFWLPALLPVASLAPWTGWWLLDESDLLVLCLAGAAYLRWAVQPLAVTAQPAQRLRGLRWLYPALCLWLLLGVGRGLADARGAAPWSALWAALWQQGLYGDYDLPGNTLRVAKSMAWSLLLLHVLYRWGQGAGLRLARGMVLGVALVCALVLWERWLYAGGLFLGQNYRTSAWFWEMHVGGAAIDVYLALALPFAWWAAWMAPHGARWLAAASLLVLTVYAVLSTYARGLYVCAGLSLLALMVLSHHYGMVSADRTLWHRRAMLGLFAVVLFEAGSALWGGGWMSERLAHSGSDLSQRWAHWQRGLALLHTPQQWLLGLGVGRLPAHYSEHTQAGALPGRVRWLVRSGSASSAWLSGPYDAQVGGELALTQRLHLQAGGHYQLRLQASAPAPVWLQARLCEQHLWYPLRCQERRWRTEAGTGEVSLALAGPVFTPQHRWGLGPSGVLSLVVLTPRAGLALERVELIDPAGRRVLKNTNFADGPRYWSTVARGHFLPWHIDNLFLEWLIERGLLGLAAAAGLMGWALHACVRGLRQKNPLALIVGVALVAALALGALVSFIEIPRVALILCLLWMVVPWLDLGRGVGPDTGG